MANVLLIGCAVIGLWWAGLTLAVRRAMRRIEFLRPVPQPPVIPDSPDGPVLSVVVPARNEAGAIEPALRSLLAQRGLDFEVILVNDHSTDATGEIGERLARENARLRVLHDPKLPEGWLGKLNAMHQGAKLARGEFILFCDADIVFRPGCLALALAAARAHGYDFLSLLPLLTFESVFENALAPVMFTAVPMFSKRGINDPDSPDAIGAGAFLMVRREVYRKLGGHEPIRREIVDDMMFARMVKRAGFRTGVRQAPELLTCRMYISNRHAFWGVEKNVLEGVEGKPWAPVVMFPVLLALLWLGCGTLITGLVTGDVRLIAAGGLLYGAQTLSFLAIRNFCRFRLFKLPLFPLGGISIGACLFKALYYRLRGGRVIWRDRVVKLG